MNRETLEELKKQLFEAHMEETALLNSSDETKKNQNREKIKEIRRKIAKLKVDIITDEERLEDLKKQLEDAHFDEFAYKNNPEKYKEAKERIKKIRKEIAKIKVNEKERGNIL